MGSSKINLIWTVISEERMVHGPQRANLVSTFFHASFIHSTVRFFSILSYRHLSHVCPSYNLSMQRAGALSSRARMLGEELASSWGTYFRSQLLLLLQSWHLSRALCILGPSCKPSPSLLIRRDEREGAKELEESEQLSYIKRKS